MNFGIIFEVLLAILTMTANPGGDNDGPKSTTFVIECTYPNSVSKTRNSHSAPILNNKMCVRPRWGNLKEVSVSRCN